MPPKSVQEIVESLDVDLFNYNFLIELVKQNEVVLRTAATEGREEAEALWSFVSSL